jgi:hypothetical protein
MRLAKATDKLITIEGQKTSTDGRKMEIEYNMLEKEGTVTFLFRLHGKPYL